MKKSELIKLLVMDIADSTGMEPYMQARFILSRCLSVGMLPPGYTNKTGSAFYTDNTEHRIYKWESEDEQNTTDEMPTL